MRAGFGVSLAARLWSIAIPYVMDNLLDQSANLSSRAEALKMIVGLSVCSPLSTEARREHRSMAKW